MATLAAQVGMAAFGYAARAWFADPAPGLGAHVARAFDQLRGLSAPAAAHRPQDTSGAMR